MLLRICLILTILAGAGVIAVSHFQVRPHVQEIIDQREKNAKDRDNEKRQKETAQKQLKETKAELDQLRNPDEDPPMPVGLKGRVLIVDPKWSFVVLDVGEKQGAVKNGVLMISRKTKLVAKVRIMSLQPERSIANILPGWN